MKSSLNKIFYKVVYHHIIYMCVFLVNLDDLFAMVCTSFYEDYGFHQMQRLPIVLLSIVCEMDMASNLYTRILEFVAKMCILRGSSSLMFYFLPHQKKENLMSINN